jgi:flagellar biosynthesis chaperone FliJ
MAERNDHDILIAVETKLEMLIAQNNQYLDQHSKLLERVVANEIKSGQDRIKLEALEQDINDLRRKTNVVDAINAAMAGLAGVVGFFFGQK